jgi:tetratricopeptide (TPR) repeat protein
VQGTVQILREGKSEWEPIQLNDLFYPGDTIRVQERSRAALLLYNETTIRLDQMTTITFSGIEKEKISLIHILRGAAYFFSRIPRSLKVTTPFVNAGVEGTEFFIRVEIDQAMLSVFEGQVAATNDVGSLILTRGQSALAQSEKAPELSILVRPRDAVQWAMYYPPVLDYLAMDFMGIAKADWEKALQKSIQLYWQGNLAGAFSSLDVVHESVEEPSFFIHRAALLLSVGRVYEANTDIEKALNLDPSSSHAFALQSIIAVVQNEKDRALKLARKAADLDPESSTARIALSYVHQAHFDLQSALTNLQDAVRLNPKNALAWARLAELWLSVGNLDRALEAAEESVALNPKLALTQTILGFAYLTQFKTREAENAFRKAIGLDQAAPLPRLGLGLAKIRNGKLKEGRREIEIAVSLDSNNALIRSYLGKAYFEENRDKLAMDQLNIAKELDPLDPTPFFYDAIRKQALNRPAEALEDLQRSIQLNENRAIYRSRLLLDQDLAARSVSLARIYDDLGFKQMALIEGWKSLNFDPGNYSAHRFLADTYSALPRHEIARISELLQSQLLQPIIITPVQPHLAEVNLYMYQGTGPADPSFNEFNPLFNRNRFAFQASGVVGGNDILGDELVHSGVWGNFSYSIGQFHYETDGVRENNDQEVDIYNVFAQVSATHKTSMQAEYRSRDIEKGDLSLLFDPDRFSHSRRVKDDIESFRFGIHHAFGPKSDLVISCNYLEKDFEFDWTRTSKSIVDQDGYMSEVQYMLQSERFNMTCGIGYFDSDRKGADLWPPFPPMIEEAGIHHTNLYVYSLINYPKNFIWSLGGSSDFFKGGSLKLNTEQFNPKLGLTWNPSLATMVRAAAFRTFKRPLLSNQTLEPTQVAGFNQFFDDGEGADVWRYGIGIDQKLSVKLYAGAEYSKRYLKEKGTAPPDPAVQEFGSEEYLYRFYLYWTPLSWLAAGPEYQFERFKNPLEFSKDEQITRLNTHRFSLGISFFHPSGFKARLKPTYVDQDGEFVLQPTGPPPPFFISKPGENRFWVFDVSIGYRLPKRRGSITIEAKNLFDETFRFQDTDPSNPSIYPERLILARFTLAF